MIYTVTFNPSLDYVVYMDRFVSGDINRAKWEMIYPGGKGINVALVLERLKIPAQMLGFTAGFTGKEIERLVKKYGGACNFVHLNEGYSRINLKINARDETAVNGAGPYIPPEKMQMLMQQIDTISAEDILVLAGSIPADIPDDIYEQILKRLEHKNIKIVVDAAGNLLKRAITYKPFLIKPNHLELGELFGVELHTEAEITRYARRLQAMGARNVLVSRGREGALLASEDGQIYCMSAPNGTLINSVGAGDSMVAGFLAGFMASHGDWREALKLGVCAGSASAFHEWLAVNDEIMALYQNMQPCHTDDKK